MKKLRLLIWMIMLYGFAHCLLAEGIRYFSIKDGLSSRQVFELEEDADRFIWMYTNSGLERYDGIAFAITRLTAPRRAMTISPRPRPCSPMQTAGYGWPYNPV